MFELIGLAVTAGMTFFSFSYARNFVRSKLRFVEAAQSGAAPWVAGIATALAGAVVFGIVPFVPAALGLFVGAGVGAGVAVGASDIRRHRLNP
jgi:hypothetical protein